jgi:glycosyltransferase involved in cell wall biosynthesis
MALQLPVVLSDLPPSRPFVGDGGCALSVPPDDHRAYADAIIRLIEDPGLRLRMGAEGRRRVEQVNNWEHESRKLIELYRELLGA